MKTEIQQETDFKPVEITIICETEEELAIFLSRLNKEMDSDDIIDSLPQYAAWEGSPIKSADITEEDCNKMRDHLQKLYKEIGEKVGWKN